MQGGDAGRGEQGVREGVKEELLREGRERDAGRGDHGVREGVEVGREGDK